MPRYQKHDATSTIYCQPLTLNVVWVDMNKLVKSSGDGPDNRGDNKWDVIVIGGGASGMMAASMAAKRGRRVLLIEKNNTLGKKLLITGGGRCNVTNAEFDNRILLSKYKESDKFLFSAFSQFSVTDSLEFFNSRNMPTKVENEGRVFPLSNKSQSVWDVLVDEMKKYGVTIKSNSTVTKVSANSVEVKTSSGTETFSAESIIIATGGTSRPETGSTGDAYAWMKKFGHKVILPTPSLVPVKINDAWVKEMQGITIPDIKVTLSLLDDTEEVLPSNPVASEKYQKEYSKKGKVLFTHFGVSGPTILNMSKDIGEHIKYSRVFLFLDLTPTLDHGQLNTALQKLLRDESNNKKIKNALSSLIPTGTVGIVLERAGIDPDIACNSVTREARVALIDSIKNLRMEVEGLLGTEKAIITSGGVELEEIDFKTMRSKIVPSIFIIGDMLNIDRPSGGYSLQLCWTTGFVAGSNA